jgi:hypothetical protein
MWTKGTGKEVLFTESGANNIGGKGLEKPRLGEGRGKNGGKKGGKRKVRESKVRRRWRARKEGAKRRVGERFVNVGLRKEGSGKGGLGKEDTGSKAGLGKRAGKVGWLEERGGVKRVWENRIKGFENW